MKKYLAWLGDKNCTTGQPHPITGRLSKYGTVFVFRTKKARDQFCDQYSHIHDCYPVATNAKECKAKYCAGETQAQFDQTLAMSEYSDGEQL